MRLLRFKTVIVCFRFYLWLLKLFLNKISEEWKELIDKDEDNKNLWAQVKTKEAGNKKELLVK